MPRRFATVAVAGLAVSLSASGCATIMAARENAGGDLARSNGFLNSSGPIAHAGH